jgi:hypothetical protein
LVNPDASTERLSSVSSPFMVLLSFKGICLNFSLELKKNILSHPVTSKQTHKIVQILMRHPVIYYWQIIYFFCLKNVKNSQFWCHIVWEKNEWR